MTQSNHTPLPWHAKADAITPDKEHRLGAIAHVQDPDDHMHRTSVSVANAEFIVKAVNNHYKMRQQLADILLVMRNTEPSAEREFALMEQIEETIEQVRA